MGVDRRGTGGENAELTGLLFSEFAKEKDRVESRAGFLLLKEEQKLEKEMNGYMNWICKAGEGGKQIYLPGFIFTQL